MRSRRCSPAFVDRLRSRPHRITASRWSGFRITFRSIGTAVNGFRTELYLSKLWSIASHRHSAWSVLLFGLAVFGLLWFLNQPYRHVYQPGHDDVTSLADGLLLLPGAQWTD